MDIFGGGVPYFATELVDSWLTVVTSNDTNTEANYTNRYGVAQAFCVTAPGTSIKAAKANSDKGHISYSGTSMAAPHVTGLAAILMQKFPTLRASAIATRIKKTASLKILTGKTAKPSPLMDYKSCNQSLAMAWSTKP